MADFTNTDTSSFAPPPFQPIRPLDVAKVKQNYGIAGFKPAKQASDASLYQMSVRSVLNWWKAQQGPTNGASPPAGTPKSNAAPAASNPSSTGPSATPKQPKPKAGATGPGMPDTAMGPSLGPLKPLPHIPALGGPVLSNTAAKQREGGMLPAHPKPPRPRFTALTGGTPFRFTYRAMLEPALRDY